MICKTSIIKLTGHKLKKLNELISDREQNCCALCSVYVEPGTKAHHEPQGALKSDEYNKMLLLCNRCHYKRHFTTEGKEIKAKCIQYLSKVKKDVAIK